MIGDVIHNILIFVVGFIASAINAFAFGGSLISFPTLIWLGLPPIVANATNTAGVWPGSLGAVWGYRREIAHTAPRMYWLIVPSIAGALVGAALLRMTSPALFDRLVPLLILFATVLFAFQERRRNPKSQIPSSKSQPMFKSRLSVGSWVPRWDLGFGSWDLGFASAMIIQFLVSIYGGYFGAGMGILMLVALAILGHEDIHQMNGLKNLLGVFINAVAAGYFLLAGMVRASDA
ncbi:MAG TPA: sulfite exporter TauE/SafE family protein, partial [Vicinamibacterales bacterium]